MVFNHVRKEEVIKKLSEIIYVRHGILSKILAFERGYPKKKHESPFKILNERNEKEFFMRLKSVSLPCLSLLKQNKKQSNGYGLIKYRVAKICSMLMFDILVV